MSTIEHATNRLADLLPALMWAIQRGPGSSRQARDELAAELIAFGEACAGTSRPFVPTSAQRRDALLHSLMQAGATESQAIEFMHAELEGQRVMLRDALAMVPPAPITMPSPPSTGIRLTPEELDAAVSGLEELLPQPDVVSALSKLRAARGEPPTAAPRGPTREELGRRVRDVWIEWAREQPNPKPSWLVPWEGLSDADKDVDKRIGETLFAIGSIMSCGITNVMGDEFYNGDAPGGYGS